MAVGGPSVNGAIQGGRFLRERSEVLFRAALIQILTRAFDAQKSEIEQERKNEPVVDL